MNNLKRKVMASAAMLLVAAIMMTSSSFAWYTLSKQGEVEKIQVSMSATDNLEIAKADKGTSAEKASMSNLKVNAGDNDSEYTWGSKVTQWDYSLATVSVPATSSNGTIKSMYYADDGRADDLREAQVPAPKQLNSGIRKMAVNIASSSTAPTNYKDCAVQYAVWVRSNNDLDDCQVLLDAASLTDDRIAISYAVYSNGIENNPDGLITRDGKKYFTLTANVPKLVVITGFVDGDKVDAADVIDGITVSDIHVLIKSDKLLTEKGAGSATTNPSQNP